MFNIFKRSEPAAEKPLAKLLVITRGEGCWHYHVSYKNTRTRGLCGKTTTPASIPLNRWGVSFGEAPKRSTWCQTCEEMKEELLK